MDTESELRFIGEEEYRPFLAAMSRGFGDSMNDEAYQAFTPPLKRGRSLAAYDGAEIVGTFVVYPLRMVVPEYRTAPIAAVSGVAVLPTHRRQGILTRMMDCQLRRAHEEGEPLAILEASESIIYGRFGFGIATHYERWSIERHHTRLEFSADAPGRVRFIEKDDVIALLHPVAERACVDRPGFVSLHPEHWGEFLADLEMERRGAGPLNFVVYEEGGRIDGYVMYRLRERTVVVVGLMATTDAAYVALWRFVFGIDLRTKIEAVNRPVDDPLPWMLADRRRLERTLIDSMWLRILDVRKALETRDYAVDGRIVFQVQDEFCPWNAGRYELEVGADGARCEATTAAPDITVPAASLSSMYLGDTRLSTLVRASRAEAAASEAVELADAMFGARKKPWWPHTL